MPESSTPHEVSLEYYRLEDLRRLVTLRPPLKLHAAVEAKIAAGSRFVLAKAKEDRHIYGINTGFGSLCETRVTPAEMEELQRNHLLSHAAGIGEHATELVSRLTLFIKLLTFRSGHTGISLEPTRRLVELWNRELIPAIPRKGTVGASGDLAPLAHLALPLLGMGEVHRGGGVVDASTVMSLLGWTPLRLLPKEGLALTNGVQYITAIGADCLMRIEDLVACADVLLAMSAQAFSASSTFYHPSYHRLTHHEERRTVAGNLQRLLEGSNHFALPTCNRSMQDPYSFRCAPQVHGAIRQAFHFGKDVMEREWNGVSDNPLFFPEEDLILLGGNLHGESVALALDFLAMAVSELANISERRTYQLLSGQRGLPDFLVPRPGVNSGMMLTQYTAASLVNENKVLSTPASVDSIPTCQLQEDHVSMGGTSAYKLCQVIENCEYVFAIELLNAAQAIELNRELRLSPSTRKVFDAFRNEVAFLEGDRPLSGDIRKARDFVRRDAGSWRTELGLS